MPYLQPIKKKDEERQPGQMQVSSGVTGSSAPAFGGGGGQAPAQNPQPQKFAGIQQYMQANRAQGRAMAQPIEEEIGKEIGGATQKAIDAGTKWTSGAIGAAKAWKGENEKRWNEFNAPKPQVSPVSEPQNPDPLAPGMAIGPDGKWTYDIAPPTPTPVFEESAFPTFDKFAVPDEAKTQARDALAKIEALGSFGGKQAFLRDRFGSSAGYTPGMSGLDAALIGQSIPDIGKRYSGIMNYLDNYKVGEPSKSDYDYKSGLDMTVPAPGTVGHPQFSKEFLASEDEKRAAEEEEIRKARKRMMR